MKDFYTFSKSCLPLVGLCWRFVILNGKAFVSDFERVGNYSVELDVGAFRSICLDLDISQFIPDPRKRN